jgi:hypothetical protein
LTATAVSELPVRMLSTHTCGSLLHTKALCPLYTTLLLPTCKKLLEMHKALDSIPSTTNYLQINSNNIKGYRDIKYVSWNEFSSFS